VAPSPRAPAGEAGQLVALAIGCAIASGAAAAAILRWPAPLYPGADFTADAWYVVGFKLGFMLGGALLWLRWHRYGVAEVLGGWRPSRRAWAGIALAFAAGVLVNASHLAAIRAHLPEASPDRIALGVLLPLVAAAIPEELLFRRLLQTRLEAVAGPLVAIVGSALLFTLWHLPSRFLLASGVEGSAGDLLSIVRGTAGPVLLAGLVFALIWHRWRSLPVVVALHFGIDLLPALRRALGDPF
jgi:membrane protease YdiL (CAAX protease family)